MKEYAKALISQGLNSGRSAGVVLLSEGLRDEREEMFVILVCDGLPMGLAFKRAGFTSKDHNAPHALMALPRVQERAAAILEARRTTGVVSLPEVTSMLQRVFAGAHSEGEYSAAHNAAFSLARLYGHVNDKSTLEIIRKPSRDPDAPSEQMLEAWAAGLPIVGASGPQDDAPKPSQSALQGPPADLLGPGPSMLSADNIGPSGPEVAGRQLDLFSAENTELTAVQNGNLFNDINGLASGPGRGGIGNGAPVGPVTGTPDACGQSGPLASLEQNGPKPPGPRLEQNGSPSVDEGTGPPGEKIPSEACPSFEELFG